MRRKNQNEKYDNIFKYSPELDDEKYTQKRVSVVSGRDGVFADVTNGFIEMAVVSAPSQAVEFHRINANETVSHRNCDLLSNVREGRGWEGDEDFQLNEANSRI